jgi:hypothetical protein
MKNILPAVKGFNCAGIKVPEQQGKVILFTGRANLPNLHNFKEYFPVYNSSFLRG